MQRSPSAFQVRNVDIDPRVRKQKLDELQRGGIERRYGEMKDRASEPVPGIDVVSRWFDTARKRTWLGPRASAAGAQCGSRGRMRAGSIEQALEGLLISSRKVYMECSHTTRISDQSSDSLGQRLAPSQSLGV